MQEITLEERERLDLILSCHLDDLDKHYLAALNRGDEEAKERLGRLMKSDRAIRDKLL